MPKSQSITVDDFLVILRDDRVKKEFNDIYEPVIKLTVDEKFNELNLKLEGLRTTISLLRNDIKSRDDQITKLTSDNEDLTKTITDLKQKNEALEQYARRDNLIIAGISSTFAEAASVEYADSSTTSASAERKKESCEVTAEKVVTFCKDRLGLVVEQNDISVAHRLPSKDGTYPILVKFVRRSVRDAIYQSRLKLQDYNKTAAAESRLYINEDLVPSVRSLFSAARKLKGTKGVENVWTSNCKVQLKKNGTYHHINSFAQLATL